MVAPEIAELLAAVSGLEARGYFTHEFGREKDDRGISVVVPEPRARALVRRLRERLPAPYTAFAGTRTSPRVGVFECEVVVAAVRDQFDIVRHARTNGENHGLDTDDIIEMLEDWHRRMGIDIVTANSDSIELEFARLPSPLRPFARELLEAFPGCESEKNVIDLLRSGSPFLLWWD